MKVLFYFPHRDSIPAHAHSEMRVRLSRGIGRSVVEDPRVIVALAYWLGLKNLLVIVAAQFYKVLTKLINVQS